MSLNQPPYRRTDGWTDGRTDGRTDGQTDGSREGQTEGHPPLGERRRHIHKIGHKKPLPCSSCEWRNKGRYNPVPCPRCTLNTAHCTLNAEPHTAGALSNANIAKEVEKIMVDTLAELGMPTQPTKDKHHSSDGKYLGWWIASKGVGVGRPTENFINDRLGGESRA